MRAQGSLTPTRLYLVRHGLPLFPPLRGGDTGWGWNQVFMVREPDQVAPLIPTSPPLGEREFLRSLLGQILGKQRNHKKLDIVMVRSAHLYEAF
jgi:hypothetical protein